MTMDWNRLFYHMFKAHNKIQSDFFETANFRPRCLWAPNNMGSWASKFEVGLGMGGDNFRSDFTRLKPRMNYHCLYAVFQPFIAHILVAVLSILLERDLKK